MSTIGLMAFPEVEELDLVGPWEIFRMWGREPGGPGRCVIVAESADPVTCSKGMRILPDFSFTTCPPLDVLLVPGGMGTRREVDNPNVIDFIRTRAIGCQAVLSVCTGAFLLERAGLLAGRRATTHWRSLDRLRQCPSLTVVDNQRFVTDGRIWTSAGVSAGIDMALAFVADRSGAQVAGRVQLAAEYYPSPIIYRGEATPEHVPAYVRADPGDQRDASAG